MIITQIALLDELLEARADMLAGDMTAYRNHAYRVINFFHALARLKTHGSRRRSPSPRRSTTSGVDGGNTRLPAALDGARAHVPVWSEPE